MEQGERSLEKEQQGRGAGVIYIGNNGHGVGVMVGGGCAMEVALGAL